VRPDSPHPIVHEELGHRGSFFIEQDGKRVARMSYSRLGPAQVILDHTEVDPALEGHGVGRKLLDAAVAWARETNTKFLVTCPFATVQFARDPTVRDVLA
jgi:predicted GNAT family acetyltransferase